MASFEHTLTGDADQFIAYLDQAILTGSVTANVEGSSDLRIGQARMLVRVYERFGALGGNRVSLSVSVLSVGDHGHVLEGEHRRRARVPAEGDGRRQRLRSLTSQQAHPGP